MAVEKDEAKGFYRIDGKIRGARTDNELVDAIRHRDNEAVRPNSEAWVPLARPRLPRVSTRARDQRLYRLRLGRCACNAVPPQLHHRRSPRPRRADRTRETNCAAEPVNVAPPRLRFSSSRAQLRPRSQVLVKYGSTWCKSCKAVLPHFVELSRKARRPCHRAGTHRVIDHMS